MKKIFFTLTLAAIALFTFSQQVPREMVVHEQGTSLG